MSEAKVMNTDAVVYVRLLDEGTDVWRPVNAAALPDGSFELLPPDFDSEAELWEFPPAAKVRCMTKEFAGGMRRLVAVARAA